MRYSDKEREFILNNYEKMTNAEIAAALGKKTFNISNWLHRHGITRSPQALSGILKRISRHNPGTFAKGQNPWNAGKKGTHFSPATEFKPGNLPKNTLYDGAIRERYHKRSGFSYKYIRVALNKWVLLHRYNWEKVHGNIPPRHVLRFKDGNTLNCDVNNLELISMAENRNRNINYKKVAETHRRQWSEGRRDTDEFVARMIAANNRELFEEAIKNKELIRLKRKQLQLRRKIRETERAIREDER